MEATKVYPKKRISWVGRLATVQEVSNDTAVIILDEPDHGQRRFTVRLEVLEDVDQRWASLIDNRRVISAGISAGRRDGKVHILRGHRHKGTVSTYCDLRLDYRAELLVFLQRPEDITCRQCILGFLDDVNVSAWEDTVLEGKRAEEQMEAISMLRGMADGSM